MNELQHRNNFPPSREAHSAPSVTRAEVQGLTVNIRTMSVREKAELIVMAYGDVHTPPSTGAIVVNQHHLTAKDAPLLRQALQVARARTGIPVLVAADQEGGAINRLRFHPATRDLRFPSAKEMQSMSLEEIHYEGLKVGMALKAAGVNCLLGPSIDIAGPGTLMDVYGRSFGDLPDLVVSRVGTFLGGMRQSNPTLSIIGKHFPGYNVSGNTDDENVSDPSEPADIRYRADAFLLVPFLDGVMIDSIIYSKLDLQPACFSKKIVNILRDRKPDAVVVTDDLFGSALLSPEVKAYKRYTVLKRSRGAGARTSLLALVQQFHQLADAAGRRKLREQADLELRENAQRAFRAGADMLLVLDGSKAKVVAQGIAELVSNNPELASQLEASAARVLALAERNAVDLVTVNGDARETTLRVGSAPP